MGPAAAQVLLHGLENLLTIRLGVLLEQGDRLNDFMPGVQKAALKGIVLP